MTNDLSIREATRHDRAAVRDMWRALALHQAAVDVRLSLAPDFLERWEADFEPWVNSPAHRLLLSVDPADDSPLAFVHARLYEHAPVFDSPPEVFVEAIWVDDRARGRGCGRHLVAAVLNWAELVGARRIRYSVLAKDPVAGGFWSAVGGDDLITYGTIVVDGKGHVGDREAGIDERDADDSRPRQEGRSDARPPNRLGFAP